MRAVHVAFEAGKNSVKLYFMIGLPTETDEDIIGIAKLAKAVIDEYYKTPGRNKKTSAGDDIRSIASFRKPFTPFQWEAQNTREELAQTAASWRAYNR